MKKVFLSVLALVCAATINAAGLSNQSIGVLVGGMDGVSYKGFLTEKIALQADLAFGLTATSLSCVMIEEGERETYKMEGTYSIWDFSLNPNILYQTEIASGLSLYAGGGLSLGMAKPFSVKYEGVSAKIEGENLYGKFGLNAMLGAEYRFSNAPVSVCLDFRPGYGLAFRQDKEEYEGETFKWTTLYNMFDWKLAAAVRYYF